MTLKRTEIVERMAESAHNAWWQTYVSLGYESRKAAWGEEFMVAFEELSEQGKEFDRMIMRAILEAFDQMKITLTERGEIVSGRDRFLMETLAKRLLRGLRFPDETTKIHREHRGVSFDVRLHVDGEPTGHIARVTVELDHIEQP